MGKRKYRRMFTTEELKYAAKILNFFAPQPKCVCGSRQFKFGIYDNVLTAICLNCGERYRFETKTRKWMRGRFAVMLVDHENLVLDVENGKLHYI